MQMCSNLITQNLKVTYHENLTTSMFKGPLKCFETVFYVVTSVGSNALLSI